jgi:hypothetical protein
LILLEVDPPAFSFIQTRKTVRNSQVSYRKDIRLRRSNGRLEPYRWRFS